jgi:hypothetical protein
LKTGVGGSGPGILARYTDTNNYFLCYLNNAGNDVTILRKLSGSNVIVQTVEMTIADNTEYALEVVLSGTVITFSVDGVLKCTHDQDLFTGQTLHGLYGTVAGELFDEFQVTI